MLSTKGVVPPPPTPVAKRPRKGMGAAWEPVPLHFKVPHGIFMLEATSVAIDSKDNVYVFCRGNMPVLVFDPDGNLIRYWGNPTPYEGAGPGGDPDPYGKTFARFHGTEFVRPHGIHIDAWDNVWLIDDMANAITKCTSEGERLMMLLPRGKVLTDEKEMQAAVGIKHHPPPMHSNIPFNRPTDVAVHPSSGEIYVTDGYGNSAVHRLKPSGELISTFGAPGTEPGEFNLVHCVVINAEKGEVLVCDRENSRVQFFDLDGSFLRQWHIFRNVSVALFPFKGSTYVLAAEQGSLSKVQQGGGLCSSAYGGWTKNIGNCIGVYEHDGDGNTKLVRLGDSSLGERPDQFLFPHSLAVNSKGDIYCAEVSCTECGQFQEPYAREMVSLRKWRMVA